MESRIEQFHQLAKLAHKLGPLEMSADAVIGLDKEIRDLQATNAELLDACILIEEWITGLFEHYGIDEDTSPRLQKLRAAIRKAEE